MRLPYAKQNMLKALNAAGFQTNGGKRA